MLKQLARRAIPPIFKIVALVVFAQTIFTRAVDPIIPMIAADLAIDVKTAALLSTAFAFPYALIQPVLGVTGDFFGTHPADERLRAGDGACGAGLRVRDRTSRCWSPCGSSRGSSPAACFRWRWRCSAISCRSTSARSRSRGCSASRSPPTCWAPSISGVIGDLFGWRGVFAILGTFSLAVVAAGVLGASTAGRFRRSRAFNRAAVIDNFRGIFADPRAKICFGAVFLEAIFIHGLFPYVAHAAERHRRDPRVDRRPPDRLLRDRRHPLFAGGAVSGARRAGAPSDARSAAPSRRRASRSWRCIFPGRRRSRSMARSAWASTCCTPASRFTSPTCRRPRAGRQPRCIRRSFYLGQAIGPMVYRLRASLTTARSRRSCSARRSCLASASSARGGWCAVSRDVASAAPAIGRDALVGHPDAFRRLARLPEHVDRDAAARIPVAADAQPVRLEQRRRAACRSPTVQSSWKAPWLRKLAEIELQRLRLDQPSGPARSRSRDARNPAGR